MSFKREHEVEFLGYKTWYRTCGDLKAGATPVVIMHGGPGGVSDYLWPIQDMLAEMNIPSVLYDQLGNGRSTHYPEKKNDASFWTVQLFTEQLKQFLIHLHLPKYILWGHSFGGMLAMEYAADPISHQVPGLQKIIVHSSPASQATWDLEANRMRSELPQSVQDVLTKHEDAGSLEDPEYQAATMEYYKLHLCRMDPMPQPMKDTFKWMDQGESVYMTMCGVNEFSCTGTLKTWTIKDRLGSIEVPCLLMNGEFDEATDTVVQEISDGLKNARWVRIADSSHVSHLENPEAVRVAAEEFLRE